MKIMAESGAAKDHFYNGYYFDLPPNVDPFGFELGYAKWQGGITVMHIKHFLNKCRWDSNMPPEYKVEIFYHDFAVVSQTQKITLAAVESINPQGLYLLGDVFIPFHRIRKINVDGKTMWKKMPEDREKDREVTEQFDNKGWRV